MSSSTEISKEQLQADLIKAQERIVELELNNNIHSDLQLMNIIDASPVPYALNDEAGNITYLNPAFIKTFGYALSDIPTLEDWWPKAYPDVEYRQWVSTTWQENLDKAKQENSTFEPIELNICCKDESKRTVLASAAPVSETYFGNHLVILYDITERKKIETALYEQEKVLSEIIDHLPSIISLKETKGLTYVWFNTQGEKLTGISRNDIITKTDYDLFPKERADLVTTYDKLVLSSGELEDIPEEFVDTPQGTRVLHTRKVAINDIDGKPKYILGVSDDITEKKEADEAHKLLEIELQQAHKMESIGHLTGGIAHDFNNLLGVILGYTELCLENGEGIPWEKLSERLNHVKKAGLKASSLISQMLAFSRNDQVENKAMDLAPLVRQDIDMLRAILPTTINVTLDVNDNLPFAMSTATTLNQILINLAINARDAMNGMGNLHISLCLAKNINSTSLISHSTITGDWVDLSVSDSGSGIDPAIVNDIFTPFYTSKEVGKGTGMGLAVVYGIVKSCDGHILIESEVGKGTTFRILFPPVISKNDEVSAPSLSPTAQLTDSTQEVLIVDDEPELALFIGEVVSNYGYHKMIVTDSTKALEIFKKEPDRYSIVITDQTMPKLTGIDLISQLRRIRPNLPAILCSGYSDDIDEKDASSLNISYFQKPINTNDFMLKVDDLLQIK